MKKKEILSTILLVIAVCLLLISPDIIYSFFSDSFKISHDIKVLLLILPLSIGLVMNPYRWLSYTVIVILLAMQVMQFVHISYFGTPLSPYALYLMTIEAQDVMSEAKTLFWQYSWIFLVVGLPFAGIWMAVYTNKAKKNILGTILLLGVFVCTGFKSFNFSFPRITPNELRFSINNSLKAFWGYFIIKTKNYEIKTYEPYNVVDLNHEIPRKINIVYIIGESVNYSHMSLFGYERKTTPHLDKLAESDNFIYMKGISGAISTYASSKHILNAIYEPDNISQTAKDETNLFKLAKSRGFKTFYISAQTEHLICGIGGVKYVDVLITKDTYPLKFNECKDAYLFELLDSQEFSDRNFIVIHQQCIHSPYCETFSREYKNERQVFSGSSNHLWDEYDNAMLYNDYLISKFFDRFNKVTDTIYYIIWASDHNELLGERGLYGHGHGYLEPETANIPVLIQSNDTDFLEFMKKIFKPTHYEIAKNIAKLLGYDIINPNEIENVFFINGVDYNGKCGYIKMKKSLPTQTIEYFSCSPSK